MLTIIKQAGTFSIEKSFLLLISISILLPGFGAIDNNAIKWLTLSLLSIFFIIYLLFVKKREVEISYQKYLIVLTSIIYLFCTALFSANINEGFITLYKLIVILSIFYLCFIAFQKIDNPLLFICQLFVVSLLIESSFTIVDFFTSNNSFAGISNNRNISSSSIVLKFIFLIYLIKNLNADKRRFQLKILEILSIIAIILLQSRLGLYSIFLIYIFYFFLYKKRRKELLISISITVLLVISFNQTSFQNKLDKNFGVENVFEDTSIKQRLSFYKASLNLYKKEPIIGHGLGSWKYKSLQYSNQNNRNILLPYYTHNDFLQILMETGVLGLIIYLLFYYLIIHRLIIITNRDKNLKFLFIVLAIMGMNSLINFPIHRSQEYIPFIIYCSFIFSKNKKIKGKKINIRNLLSILLILLIPSSLVGLNEHKSLINQDKLLSDYKGNKFTLSVKDIEKINYKLPNLSSNVVPVSTYLSRYYFNQKKYRKSLELLKYSLKINNEDLMTNELLLRNYIFINQQNDAHELAKDLLYKYPDNLTYAQLYFSLSRDLKLISEIELDPIIYVSKNIDIHILFLNFMIEIKGLNNSKVIEYVDFSISKFPDNLFLKNLFANIE